MSDRTVGDSSDAKGKRKTSAKKPAPKKRPGQRGTDVGRALRSVYDETLREEVPDDIADLLGKLS